MTTVEKNCCLPHRFSTWFWLLHVPPAQSQRLPLLSAVLLLHRIVERRTQGKRLFHEVSLSLAVCNSSIAAGFGAAVSCV